MRRKKTRRNWTNVLCCAPGKIVLWGEYAVLAGAPAVIMAVNRYAQVDLTASTTGWRFDSRGFLTPSIHNFTGQFSSAPAAAFAEAILQNFGYDQLVKPFAYAADTIRFYAGQEKLGLGSSAAICTASYVALARWLDRPSDLATALRLHSIWQGGTGSGLDVAASWHGGVIAYQLGRQPTDPSAVSKIALPADLGWQVVWTGRSATTQSAVENFTEWRKRGDTPALQSLVDASQDLTASVSLDELTNYQRCLRDLDTTSHLKIFTPEHDQLGKIAAEFGLVYKPCGAGGGDIGIAFGYDPNALAAFSKRVDETSFQTLGVEIAEYGVQVSD
jgi:phosphomevalonate kinase